MRRIQPSFQSACFLETLSCLSIPTNGVTRTASSPRWPPLVNPAFVLSQSAPFVCLPGFVFATLNGLSDRRGVIHTFSFLVLILKCVFLLINLNSKGNYKLIVMKQISSPTWHKYRSSYNVTKRKIAFCDLLITSVWINSLEISVTCLSVEKLKCALITRLDSVWFLAWFVSFHRHLSLNVNVAI